MIFERLAVGPLQCNCLVLGCEQTRAALVVDPGDEVERIVEVIDRHQLRVQAILQTHAHFDHVGATRPLQARTGAPVYLHPDDRFLMENLALQVALFGLAAPQQPTVDEWLKDNAEIQAGTVAARVIHTPGHSPGSVCFLLSPGRTKDADSVPLLLSGDTLFAGSIGRTDLWGGSYEQIMRSIQKRLLCLPDETEVFPGHGPPTTVAQEKRFNPFFQEFF